MDGAGRRGRGVSGRRVAGEMGRWRRGGDDSGVVVSESGVTKVWMDELVGYAFEDETRAVVRAFFETCRYA